MSADAIIYCLEHLTDYRQFERLCSDLMAGSGYNQIDPLGGTGDRGRDALYRNTSGAGLTVFAYTVRSEWRKKLEHDCQRIRAERHQPTKLVFVCTSTMTASEKNETTANVYSRYGWDLELYDLERIRVLLSGNLRHLVAQHPAIFCPPFFPQRGGLSIAASADTIVIDHVYADHALATWLARKLALDGFLTWCYGTAPLAGENADQSIRTLLQSRAAQYLPILSHTALADRDFMDRCGFASAPDDLLLPCWSSPVGDTLKGSRLGRIHPARFDASWSDGLRDVVGRLNANGVKHHHSTESGRAIALRAYFLEPVVSPTPERVFASVFRTTVPPSILICRLDRPLQETEADGLRRIWAFVEADSLTLLSFVEPPDSVPLTKVDRLPEYSWEDFGEREGKKSTDVVKELVRRSLDVACNNAGLHWCNHRHVYYFPHPASGQTSVALKHVDGRDTRVAMNGQRQYGWGGRASIFHYQLGPRFRAGRDEQGAWWVTVRLYVRVTDTAGVPFELKDISRRRKAVTKGWWNKEWLARLLGLMQALRTNGADIRVGAGSRAVTVSTLPLEWLCPISIDVAALERVRTFEEEMAELRNRVDRDEADEEDEDERDENPPDE
jgi:Restriction endonuclease